MVESSRQMDFSHIMISLNQGCTQTGPVLSRTVTRGRSLDMLTMIWGHILMNRNFQVLPSAQHCILMNPEFWVFKMLIGRLSVFPFSHKLFVKKLTRVQHPFIYISTSLTARFRWNDSILWFEKCSKLQQVYCFPNHAMEILATVVAYFISVH